MVSLLKSDESDYSDTDETTLFAFESLVLQALVITVIEDMHVTVLVVVVLVLLALRITNLQKYTN